MFCDLNDPLRLQMQTIIVSNIRKRKTLKNEIIIIFDGLALYTVHNVQFTNNRVECRGNKLKFVVSIAMCASSLSSASCHSVGLKSESMDTMISHCKRFHQWFEKQIAFGWLPQWRVKKKYFHSHLSLSHSSIYIHLHHTIHNIV